MPVYNHNKASIFYTVSGESGPWITLVNGHTRTHKDFKMMVKVLVKAGYRCLSLDNRGCGESSSSASFTFDDMVNDVHRLWQHLGIESTHLLGISMGGMISQKLAILYPSKINKLILISTSARPKWIQDISNSGWGHSLAEVTNKLRYYFADNFLEKNKLLVDSMAKQIWKGVEQGTFSEGALYQKQAMKELDLSNEIVKIKSPTLIVHGMEDQIIIPQAASELDDLINNSQLELIDEVGHLLLAEANKVLYEKVVDFIQ